MSHNAFIHGGPSDPTAWMPGFLPLQLDWQTIDQLLFESINGDQGGTWAPATEIIIGGAGVRFAAKTTFDGDTEFNAQNQFDDIVAFSTTSFVTFSSDAVFDATSTVEFQSGFTVSAGDVVVTLGSIDVVAGVLHVGGLAQIDGDLFVGDDISVTDDLTVLGDSGFQAATFAGAVIVNAAATLNGTTTLTAGVTFGAASATTFTSGATMSGTVDVSLVLNGNSSMSFATGGTLAIDAGAELQMSGILRDQGTGRTVYRRYNLPASPATVGVNDGTLFVVPPLGGGGVTYTLSTTGAIAGDVIIFTAYQNTTANYAGVASWNLNFTGTPGENPAVAFYYDGAVWQTLWHSQI